MAYEAELQGRQVEHGGQTLSVEQRGEQTWIGVRSGGQCQSTSVQTSPWQAPPRLYRLDDGALLELRAGETRYYAVRDGGLHSLERAPELHGAESLNWREVPDGQQESEALAPMKPMGPMKPM